MRKLLSNSMGSMAEQVKREKFASYRHLAISPEALALTFAVPATVGNSRVGAFEVVDISGPLTSKSEGLWDSYESIKGRIQAACLSDATTVVLRVNSPGGEVHDCFQTARDIRSMCAASGKQLVSYIDGQGCSAAYAIASAAPTVVAAETSVVGSIGVITERQDVSEMLAAQGIKVSYVTSGSKKAYGAPEIPESDAERMDSQRTINNLAAMFFTLVEQHRGIPSTQVAMLEAGTFIGQEAVNARLVDSIGTFESLFVSSPNTSPSDESDPQPNEARVTQAQLMEALKALIESGDAEGISAARALLAAATAEGEPEDPPEDKPEEDAPPDDKPEEEPAAASVETAAALATKLEAVSAENKTLKARLDADAKSKFFAEHSVSDTLKGVLESKPLAEIEAIVAAMQAKPAIKAGLGTVKTTLGTNKQRSGLDIKTENEIRAGFGRPLLDDPSEPKFADNVQVFRRKVK